MLGPQHYGSDMSNARTTWARKMTDSKLLAAAKEARGYLMPGLDEKIAAEYRAGLAALESEIRRREI